MKKTVFIMLFTLTVCCVNADVVELAYKWSMRGRDVLSPSTEDSTGISTVRRLKQKGILVFTFNTETEQISGCKLLKYWKEKGVKTVYYSYESFLSGKFTLKKKMSDKSKLFFEISSIHENYIGYLKNGVKMPDKTPIMFPPMFKGMSSWKNVCVETGGYSTGEAKLTLKFDKKSTALLAGITKDEEATTDEGTSTEKAGTEYKILFAPKVAEVKQIDKWTSVYWSDVAAAASGLFEKLAIGSEENNYTYPTMADFENAQESYVLKVDKDSKKLVLGEIQSRDSYLLNRDNHIGSQKASTISNFQETVLALLKDAGLDQDVINNITNNIDFDKFLERLEAYIKENAANFNESLTENIDVTTIIKNMDATDIKSLIEKLKTDGGLSTFDNTKIENMLKQLKTYIEAGNSETFNTNLTKNIDPTTIIDNMDAADLASLKAKLGVGGGSVAAADVTGLEEFISNNAKLQLITVTKAVDLDKLTQIEIDDGETVKLSNHKAAIAAILNYIHNVLGANQIYDANDL